MSHIASAMENMFLVAGSAYLVQVHGWSLWTFAGAIFFGSVSTVNKSNVGVKNEKAKN